MSNPASIVRIARLGAAGVLLSLGLAACGGGGSSDAPAGSSPADAGGATATTPQAVPDSASASAAGFAEFQRALRSDDTAEPVEIGSFKPPTDDTAEPVPLS